MHHDYYTYIHNMIKDLKKEEKSNIQKTAMKKNNNIHIT